MPTPPLATTGTPTASLTARVELEVESLARAVAIHRREQDLSDAALGGLGRPGDAVDAGRGATTVQEHLEPIGGRRSSSLGVDRAHDALRSELAGDLGDQLRTLDRGGVDTHLVGAGTQHPPSVLERANPPADRERDEHLLGDPVHHVDRGLTGVARRRDVEEHQLVGALGVVPRGQLDRVTGVAQIDEVGALDDPTVGDVEARNDPGHLHRRPSAGEHGQRLWRS